ncbi:MAG TPA: hypothetical protein VIM25_01295 [Candidatus Limnocylindrales bacterium]
MAKFEDNISPYLSFVEGAAPSSPAATNFRLFYDSADHGLKWKNSAGTVVAIATGTPLTNPMTTLDDIIKGGAAGAPARLAVGAAGGALSVINGAVAWNSGTSFPASKATGDRFLRTDLSPREYYWDGTRWVSEQLFIVTPHLSSLDPYTTGSVFIGYIPIINMGANGVLLTDLWAHTNVSSTNNGSNYWTVKLLGASGVLTAVALDTSADTAGTGYVHHGTSTTAVDTTDAYVGIAIYKTAGTPGTLNLAALAGFRIIGT